MVYTFQTMSVSAFTLGGRVEHKGIVIKLARCRKRRFTLTVQDDETAVCRLGSFCEERQLPSIRLVNDET